MRGNVLLCGGFPGLACQRSRSQCCSEADTKGFEHMPPEDFPNLAPFFTAEPPAVKGLVC